MFRRLMMILKAKFSKALDRAENPSETLDYAYTKQMELLQGVKEGIASVVTAKKQLQLQADRLEKQLVKLDEQARQAVGAGRDDLAQRALELKAGVQGQLRDLDPQIAALQERQDQLVAQERQLADALARFRTQKEVEKARYNAAQAMVAIGEAATGIGEGMSEAGMAVQRAHEKTEQMEARAGALDELIASGTLQDFTGGGKSALDRELEELSSKQGVQDELARLKAELGAGEPSPALGQGEPAAQATPSPEPETEAEKTS